MVPAGVLENRIPRATPDDALTEIVQRRISAASLANTPLELPVAAASAMALSRTYSVELALIAVPDWISIVTPSKEPVPPLTATPMPFDAAEFRIVASRTEMPLVALITEL